MRSSSSRSALPLETAPPSVTGYFDRLSPERGGILRHVRDLVLTVWPNATEDMALGIPTYHLEGEPFCALAGQKHFMVLYIMPYDLLNAFTMDLKI